MVFVPESPHVDEMPHGYVLAGSGGRKVHSEPALMRPRSANEWRDFWRDGGERELAAQLDEFEPHSVRIATLLGSGAPLRALVAELGRIREHELGTPSDPVRDEQVAARAYEWFPGNRA